MKIRNKNFPPPIPPPPTFINADSFFGIWTDPKAEYEIVHSFPLFLDCLKDGIKASIPNTPENRAKIESSGYTIQHSIRNLK